MGVASLIDGIFSGDGTMVVPMRYRTSCVLAFVSVLAVEGTSYARATASPDRAWVEESSEDAGAGVGVVDAAPVSGSSFADPDGAEGAVGTARIYVLCHISHHPRDGLRPEQHACPLFIADGLPSVPPVALRQGRS
jgi:hypothetical protein